MPASLPDYPSLSRSILRHYRAADAQATDEGLSWYDLAFTQCERMGLLLGLRASTVACVVSQLSPRVTWSRNLEIAELLIWGRPRPSWVLSRSWDAAKLALEAEDPFATFGRRADKTRSFAQAICGDPHAVVVDVWACRAAGVDPDAIHSRSGYAFVANAYRAAARRVPVTPRDLQAITWCHLRRSGA